MSYEVDVWSISLVKVFFVVLLLLLRQMVSEITSGNNGSSVFHISMPTDLFALHIDTILLKNLKNGAI